MDGDRHTFETPVLLRNSSISLLVEDQDEERKNTLTVIDNFESDSVPLESEYFL
jgi:hypothetical protein